MDLQYLSPRRIEANGKAGRDMNVNGSGNGRQMAVKQQRPKKK